MARKLGVFGPRAEVLEAMNGNGHEESKAQASLAEQTLSTGSTDWTPEQTEQYIDWRLQNLDAEIASLRGQLDELIAMRKRWLAVTGGRSKMNGNGGPNGSVATS
jgi:ketopantoate reductase